MAGGSDDDPTSGRRQGARRRVRDRRILSSSPDAGYEPSSSQWPAIRPKRIAVPRWKTLRGDPTHGRRDSPTGSRSGSTAHHASLVRNARPHETPRHEHRFGHGDQGSSATRARRSRRVAAPRSGPGRVPGEHRPRVRGHGRDWRASTGSGRTGCGGRRRVAPADPIQPAVAFPGCALVLCVGGQRVRPVVARPREPDPRRRARVHLDAVRGAAPDASGRACSWTTGQPRCRAAGGRSRGGCGVEAHRASGVEDPELGRGLPPARGPGRAAAVVESRARACSVKHSAPGAAGCRAVAEAWPRARTHRGERRLWRRSPENAPGVRLLGAGGRRRPPAFKRPPTRGSRARRSCQLRRARSPSSVVLGARRRLDCHHRRPRMGRGARGGPS